MSSATMAHWMRGAQRRSSSLSGRQRKPFNDWYTPSFWCDIMWCGWVKTERANAHSNKTIILTIHQSNPTRLVGVELDEGLDERGGGGVHPEQVAAVPLQVLAHQGVVPPHRDGRARVKVRAAGPGQVQVAVGQPRLPEDLLPAPVHPHGYVPVHVWVGVGGLGGGRGGERQVGCETHTPTNHDKRTACPSRPTPPSRRRAGARSTPSWRGGTSRGPSPPRARSASRPAARPN